jgi:hypothetical protein
MLANNKHQPVVNITKYARAEHLERGSAALDVLKLGVQLAILHDIGRESGVRPPLGGSARGGLLHHLVDLLEGEALGLGDEEVGVDECTCA